MTREPAVAGMFYPRQKEELKKMIQDFLQQAETFEIEGELKALIVPHAGYLYSGMVAVQGFKLLEKNKFKKVILLGPSHYLNFSGASLADENFSTPLGIIKCGKIGAWTKNDLIKIIPEAQAAEHSLEVELPFLQETLGDFELYALVLGRVDEEKLAKTISKFIDKETLVIASSDLSHYLSYGQAVIKDNETISKILKGDDQNLNACGKTPITVLMRLAKWLGWKAKLIDYHNSGDTSGDKTRVVGYTAIAYIK